MRFVATRDYAKANNLTHDDVIQQCKSGILKSITPYRENNTAQKMVKVSGGEECYIIALTTMKGGVAKTTTAVHLALHLANMNLRVLLIDADHQNQCKEYFPEKNYDSSSNLYNVLKGESIKSCIHNLPETGLDIIFSSFDVAIIGRNYNNVDWLATALEPIKQNYDFIIVDTSPAYDAIVDGVLRGSTHLIIPVSPEKLSITGYNHNLKILSQSKVSHSKIIGVLPSKVNLRYKIHGLFLEELKSALGDLVFNNYVPESAHLLNCLTENKNIFEYREKSPASQAFKRFTFELLKRL
jgi:chromosome partitioning protein